MNKSASDDVVRFSQSVRRELEEMAKLGLHVPDGAVKRTEDMEEMEDLQYMRVSECADLLITLAI